MQKVNLIHDDMLFIEGTYTHISDMLFSRTNLDMSFYSSDFMDLSSDKLFRFTFRGVILWC